MKKEFKQFIAGINLWWDGVDKIQFMWNVIISIILFIIMFPLIILVGLALNSITQ